MKVTPHDWVCGVSLHGITSLGFLIRVPPPPFRFHLSVPSPLARRTSTARAPCSRARATAPPGHSDSRRAAAVAARYRAAALAARYRASDPIAPPSGRAASQAAPFFTVPP